MDVARSSIARYRLPDGIPSGASDAERASDTPDQPMPVASAILWTPTVGQPSRVDSSYPMFFTQRALVAVHDHGAARPQGSSSLGFLVGEVLRSAPPGKSYVVVTSTIPVPWSVGGGRLKPALVQGRIIAEEELRRREGQLVGWYRVHDAADASLSSSDVAAHLACFDQPWCVALVIARSAQLAGGVFRIGADAARSNAYLPFYELVTPDSVLPNGRKITDLAWTNYRTEEDVFASDRAAQRDLPVQPRLLFPDEAEPEPGSAPTPARQRLPPDRLIRVAGVGAVGMVAVAALFGLYSAIAPGPSGRAPGVTRAAAPAATGVEATERIDRLADTVALAVAAYDLRVRLLEGRKMTCADLARGLVELEQRWTRYNAARQRAVTLDSVRNARDRALYADVDAAERRYERSPCPRP